MATIRTLADTELIDRVIAFGRSHADGDSAEAVARFVREFYAHTPAEDAAERTMEDLHFAALRLFDFMHTRIPGEDRLRIYDPDPETDGWASPRTVIDIVTDNRPFIVDSVTTELNRRNIAIHFVSHPIYTVSRSPDGALQQIDAEAADNPIAEAVVRIEIDRQGGRDDIAALTAQIAHILEDVRLAVDDWPTMRDRLAAAGAELPEVPPEAGTAGGHCDRGEVTAFLRWLADDHFTFLGYRCYDIRPDDGHALLGGVPGSALGIMRRAEERDNRAAARGRPLPREVLQRLHDPGLLIVTKSARRATVHRGTHMDSVEIKRYDAAGTVIGVHRFLGLYTSLSYNRSPAAVPLLRQKVAAVMERSGFAPAGHGGKALRHVLENFPRDELFQYDEDALLETALGIVHLRERPRLRLFARNDSFGWAVSSLVFVPRERYDSALRERISGILESAFSGRCEAWSTQLDNSPLACLQVLVRTTPGEVPAYRIEAVEARLVAAVRGWDDNLREALKTASDDARAAALERRYGAAFPRAYRDRFTAGAAVLDIERMEIARKSGGLALNLYRPPEPGRVRFKIYRCGEQLILSDVLPILENMGFRVTDEFPYRLSAVHDDHDVWIHDLGLHDRDDGEIDTAGLRERFQTAFARIWRGEAEDDGFNELVIRARLDWREVTVLRAYAKFLRQVRIPFSQTYMEQTLAANPALARRLVNLFVARFNPRLTGDRGETALTADILAALDQVESLDQDRIIRRFLNAVQATLRTNFFQTDRTGEPLAHIAFKLDSARLDDMPLPRPMAEIFVYSPRVEGVHLRGGPVARGGLRWSSRPEDYRTEILGLMKAQMVKNAVIVPVGAKGGFVVKKPQADRDAHQAEGVACYRIFIGALLEITDNMQDGAIISPPDTVRHDGDDPYLVVAADKGTATFSDIANSIAEARGFWLGDAFASGGSAGYDHKRMGITARGAWEAVKRHFREIGHDTQNEPFTVVGIGDMSGDVFGNGMLLSRHIRLVGAFNHLHIFLDPDPGAEAAFAERQRLFGLPRSSWRDYDPGLISQGGGVFDRSAKSIALSPEIRLMLDTDEETLTPNQLISALLRAPVDLLWNGGIGTYIRAAGETDAEVGDRANDAVRISAAELRCEVVGEGGNLGLTQRARIEAARRGVRLNSDAVDNSAGVDCSDHEVNIKVLLGAVEAAGDLSREERNALLAEMTDDVAQRCLTNNYLQTAGISIIESLGTTRIDLQHRMMQSLERDGRLDRSVEALPDDETVAEMRSDGEGLSRPEISVLYAYAKLALYDELLASDVPDDPFLTEDLERYFPEVLVDRYRPRIHAHRLRREIIATVLANSIVNRASMVFVPMTREATGMEASDIARAYVATRAAFNLQRRWTAIESLDNKVDSTVQHDMYLVLRALMEHSTLWFLRRRPQPLDCAAVAQLFGAGIDELQRGIDTILPDNLRAEVSAHTGRLTQKGVPDDLAQFIAAAGPLHAACFIVDAADHTGAPVRETGRLFFAIGRRLGLDWLRTRAGDIAASTHWQRQAAAASIDELYNRQTSLTTRVLDAGGNIEQWAADNKAVLTRHENLIADLRAQPEFDFAMLTVATRQMNDLLPL